ncbi:MAG: preprotein translocase subunit SecA [Alphaproteobacteria bacterium]|nr:preprotein translocase subunit SecA [Alphaproteobacteria bacterium]
MIFKFATRIFGTTNQRLLKGYWSKVPLINALEPTYAAMSDAELQAQTGLFRERLAQGALLNTLLPEAFAVVREAAKRTLGQRHYDVQLIGGMVLHGGNIAEMKTGEGKTLVATLAVYLNALAGKGVHVVTVNDYLAKRDANWMGQIYRFLGMSVGVIVHEMSDDQRRAAYACDITYGTNNEYGFDYLRDNMKFSHAQMVQRPFQFAIVDEVDSILIDEARTPLIISGPSDLRTDLYPAVDKIIPKLQDSDFEKDEKHRTIALTESGQEHVENLLRDHGLLREGSMYDLHNINLVHHVNQALRAHKLFAADTDYIVKDGRVILIDEFTGRMMEGRRLSDGLHQAIEAKEGVDVQTENQTLASITYQNYFRLYPKLAGMTGTALTEAAEFQEIYKLGVVAIPTHVPVARQDHDDKIYKSLNEKNEAIIKLIEECVARQQPVLVGTVSIEKSESLSALLKNRKITHNVLNARYHEQEAYIVAQAGRPGAVTIATNMAGRGTDIQLGGNADMRIAQETDPSWDDARKMAFAQRIRDEVAADKELVIKAGGLYVIGTERHESRRIDNQLRGRSGRQGDPGASMFFLSVEDDLMRVFAGDRMEALLANPSIGLQEGEALAHPWISKLLERAQAKVETMHFDTRKNILKFDNVMNDQRKAIYEQRREIMAADSLEDMIHDMRDEVVASTVRACIPQGSYAEQWDINGLHAEILRLFNLDLPLHDWAKEEGIAEEEIEERIRDAAARKMAEKTAQVGADFWRRVEKSVILQTLDQHWKEHLLALDHLRQGINLRAFGQRDPLNEYKYEAFAMFEAMLGLLREGIIRTLSMVEINVAAPPPQLSAPSQPMHETRLDPALQHGSGDRSSLRTMPPRRAFDKDDSSTWGKVQRNAECPCGSGKKFKHCHGALMARTV